MGERKEVTIAGSGRGGAGGTPRVTARRATRYSTRASTRSLQSIRAPIVLEIGTTIIRVGYADNFQPTYMISVPVTDAASSTNGNYTEAQWYTTLSPWIDVVYDRLLCIPNTRKVLVLHAHFVVPEAWKLALEQILWNKGVPAVTFMSALEILPVAQGWKRGLVVHVSRDEAVCICHSDGHLLPFTFQSVPECGYQHLLEDPQLLQREWTSKMDHLLLDEQHNPNSFVVAILKCLEACPRDIRYDVIHNIVFCGDGAMIIPDLGRRVAQRVEQILEGNQPEIEARSAAESPTHMSAVPVAMTALQPLGSSLRMISCAPHRPDMIAWTASSLWAATWNRYENEESRIPWKRAPQD